MVLKRVAQGGAAIQATPGPSKDSEKAPYIVVFGLTGSGKSTFISHLTDELVAVGHSLESCTTSPALFRCTVDGFPEFLLVDTPGFDDTSRSDIDILKSIATPLSGLYNEGRRLAGVLYIHRITDMKVSGSALRSFDMFKRLCGTEAFPGAILVSTMWDALKKQKKGAEIGKSREDALLSKNEFWGDVVRGGGASVHHLGDKDSATEIISLLLGERRSLNLAIQREMVDESKTLESTSAGGLLQEDLAKSRDRYLEELKDLEEALEEAKNEKDDDRLEYILLQRQNAQAKADRAQTEKQQLATSLSQLFHEMNPTYARHVKDLELERARVDKAHEELERFGRERDRELKASQVRPAHPDRHKLELECIRQEKEQEYQAKERWLHRQLEEEREKNEMALRERENRALFSLFGLKQFGNGFLRRSSSSSLGEPSRLQWIAKTDRDRAAPSRLSEKSLRRLRK